MNSDAILSSGFFLLGVIFLIALIIGVTLIIRDVVCWYWKINEIVSLLQEMTQLSKDQKEIQIQLLAFIKAAQKET